MIILTPFEKKGAWSLVGHRLLNQVMNKFIYHEGRINNNMQKWKKKKEKEKIIIIGNL